MSMLLVEIAKGTGVGAMLNEVAMSLSVSGKRITQGEYVIAIERLGSRVDDCKKCKCGSSLMRFKTLKGDDPEKPWPLVECAVCNSTVFYDGA